MALIVPVFTKLVIAALLFMKNRSTGHHENPTDVFNSPIPGHTRANGRTDSLAVVFTTGFLFFYFVTKAR
jgi:hypothetical protein